MKRLIRHWLGIEDLASNQQMLCTELAHLHHKAGEILRKLDAAHDHAVAANRGMARLLAKLDPQFNRDELDPVRRAESDAINDQIMRRLISEHVESNKMEGDQ